ncbi:MAG: hypothetical protein HYR56_29915 [Acidobacteria bacterium]|nr:hypothetical protein [Acidobacteriota bacterium]MBI3422780.1 hypothetical protein [Acidobacteriota bacterium]
MFFVILGLVSFSSGPASGLWPVASAQTNYGVLDTGQVKLPDNYTGFTPPALGATFTDSAYGTTIRRVSNGLSQFIDAVHHEYATISPFNRDNTRLLLVKGGDYYVADLSGNVIISPTDLALGRLPEPRWSTTDASIFYFHQGNQLFRYDLRTRQKTPLRTFAQFDSIGFGVNDGELSADGDALLIIGYKSGQSVLSVYRLSTDALSATLDVGAQGGIVFSDFTPSGNVVVRWGGQGAGRYKGFELFDPNMNFQRQLYGYNARADLGRDVNGDEIMVFTAENDPQPAAGCETSGIQKLRLADGQKTCLLPLFYNLDASISVNNSGGHPWALITTTDASGTAKPNDTLPGNWQSLWKARYNEVLLVKLDGSERRRLAHHRSRDREDYYWTPRASLSRDGRYALFDSNFGTYPLPFYADAFLLPLNPGSNVSALASVSAASFSNAAFAPETIIAAFGTNLATGRQAATTQPLPTTLLSTTVSVRDAAGTTRNAPLFFVSSGQVNFIVPAGTAAGSATITVTSGDGSQAAGTVQIERVAPGLFTANANGQGVPAAVALRIRNSAQSYESVARLDAGTNRLVTSPIDLGPASDQVYLILYATGVRNRTGLTAVNVKVGGVEAPVNFAQAQGSLAGLDQINALIPRSLIGRNADLDVVLTVDGKTANTVRVNIR